MDVEILAQSWFVYREKAMSISRGLDPFQYTTLASLTIWYVNFTSLYPFVVNYKKYMVGHPEIIVNDFKTIDEYFGLAKVRVLPPNKLYHAVLPHVSNGKLTFPLCAQCAEKQSKESCHCPEENRALTGTWCTPAESCRERLQDP